MQFSHLLPSPPIFPRLNVSVPGTWWWDILSQDFGCGGFHCSLDIPVLGAIHLLRNTGRGGGRLYHFHIYIRIKSAFQNPKYDYRFYIFKIKNLIVILDFKGGWASASLSHIF